MMQRVNVVFISPAFPPQFFLFCQALKAEGINVLGVGDTPSHELPWALRDALTEYVHVQDLMAGDNALRTMGYLTSRYGKLDRIESLNEYWLQLEADLRDDFNVFGPRSAQMRRMRSKIGMKEVFRANGIPCGPGERVESAAQVRAFVEQYGLPVVLKPDVGVGAARTWKVTTRDELEAALSAMEPGYVVEAFIDAPMTTFDGLVDRDGKILFATSYRYSGGVMDIVNKGLDLHYYSRREIPPKLEEVGLKVVKAFELRERFFHAEFFEKDGGYLALEVNFRPPGGFTTDMMNYAGDADIYKLWASLLAGRDLSAYAYSRKYFCGYVSRRFGRRYRYSHEDLQRELGTQLVDFRHMPPVFAGAMGDLAYTLRSPREEELVAAIARVEEPA